MLAVRLVLAKFEYCSDIPYLSSINRNWSQRQNIMTQIFLVHDSQVVNVSDPREFNPIFNFKHFSVDNNEFRIALSSICSFLTEWESGGEKIIFSASQPTNKISVPTDLNFAPVFTRQTPLAQ